MSAANTSSASSRRRVERVSLGPPGGNDRQRSFEGCRVVSTIPVREGRQCTQAATGTATQCDVDKAVVAVALVIIGTIVDCVAVDLRLSSCVTGVSRRLAESRKPQVRAW